MKQNRMYVTDSYCTFILSIILFFSFALNISSFLFFEHSFKIYVFLFFVPFFLAYLLKFKTLRFSSLSLFILTFLIYAFLITSSGYYSPDGLFLIFFLFSLYIVFVAVENNERKDTLIDSIFFIAFLDALFSIFEYTLKTSGLMNVNIIPYFIFISDVKSIGGLLFQPNLNALLINLGLVITSFKIIGQIGNRKEQIYLYIIYIFFAFAASITSSRAGMLALLAVFFLIFSAKRFGVLELTQSEKRIFLCLFAIYLFIFLINKYSPVAKFSNQGLIEDNSVDVRLIVWLATILLWLKHPVFGTGLETFKFLNNSYQFEAAKILRFPSNIINYFTWAHCEPLQILEELGIVAFLPIVLVSVSYYIRLIKKEKNIKNWIIPSLLLVFFVQAGLSWPLRHPALLATFFIILALVSNQAVFTIGGREKTLFLTLISLIFIVASFCMYPHIRKDIYFSLYIPKRSEAKIGTLYKLSSDPYLFWIAASRFLHIALPLYLIDTTGVSHIVMVKDNVKDTKITNDDEKKLKVLRQKFLLVASRLEKLHKIWSSEYYLGMAYLFNGDLEKAKYHARLGIRMNPNVPYLWNLIHYINMKQASIKTGRPITDFMPTKDEVKSLMNKLENMHDKGSGTERHAFQWI